MSPMWKLRIPACVFGPGPMPRGCHGRGFPRAWVSRELLPRYSSLYSLASPLRTWRLMCAYESSKRRNGESHHPDLSKRHFRLFPCMPMFTFCENMIVFLCNLLVRTVYNVIMLPYHGCLTCIHCHYNDCSVSDGYTFAYF